MRYAPLGRTGLSVSKFCLGTMNFGPQTSEADSFAIMDQALSLGINFFDTANVYGWKKSNRGAWQIGRASALSDDKFRVGEIAPDPPPNPQHRASARPARLAGGEQDFVELP